MENSDQNAGCCPSLLYCFHLVCRSEGQKGLPALWDKNKARGSRGSVIRWERICVEDHKQMLLTWETVGSFVGEKWENCFCCCFYCGNWWTQKISRGTENHNSIKTYQCVGWIWIENRLEAMWLSGEFCYVSASVRSQKTAYQFRKYSWVLIRETWKQGLAILAQWLRHHLEHLYPISLSGFKSQVHIWFHLAANVQPAADATS